MVSGILATGVVRMYTEPSDVVVDSCRIFVCGDTVADAWHEMEQHANSRSTTGQGYKRTLALRLKQVGSTTDG